MIQSNTTRIDGMKQTAYTPCDICGRKTHYRNIRFEFRPDGDYEVCNECRTD